MPATPPSKKPAKTSTKNASAKSNTKPAHQSAKKIPEKNSTNPAAKSTKKVSSKSAAKSPAKIAPKLAHQPTAHPAPKNTRAVMALLEKAYPEALPLLDFSSSFELLIAVMLSAQTTDARVNMVTPALFKKYPDAHHLSRADISDVERLIGSVNFYRTKARHVVQTARILHEQYGGAPPQNMEELTSLPGVGRKSASVVLSAVFGKSAVVVDTHFARVARRLGWTARTDAHGVEKDVSALLDASRWNSASMRLNYHGRYVCKARAPLCASCVLRALCPSRDGAD